MATTITVKLFGPQAQLAERRELEVEVDRAPATAGDVLAAIAATCPAIGESIGNSKLAINHELADTETTLTPSDEVALIGMLGGG